MFQVKTQVLSNLISYVKLQMKVKSFSYVIWYRYTLSRRGSYQIFALRVRISVNKKVSFYGITKLDKDHLNFPCLKITFVKDVITCNISVKHTVLFHTGKYDAVLVRYFYEQCMKMCG